MEPELGRPATWAGGRQKCRGGEKEARLLAGQAPNVPKWGLQGSLLVLCSSRTFLRISTSWSLETPASQEFSTLVPRTPKTGDLGGSMHTVKG